MQTTNYPWLHTYPSGIDWHQSFAAKPLCSVLDDTALLFPNHPCIDFLGKIYSYAEIHALVLRTAKGLQQLGVKPGTKVGLLLPNCPLFIIATFAILRLGGVVVNYNPLYSLRELKHQVEDSETTFLFTLDIKALYHKATVLLHTTVLEKVIVGSMEAMLPFPKNILFRLTRHREIAMVNTDIKVVDAAELTTHGPLEGTINIDPHHTTAMLQYTGGTTGVPKGAILTHANLYTNVMQINAWLPELEDGKERILAILPLFHIFAMTAIMNLGIKKAACIVLHPRFYIENVIRDLKKKHITLLPGVPTLFSAIINETGISAQHFSHVKLAISGGASLPLSVREQFETVSGCKLIEGYGLTECAPVVAVQPTSIPAIVGSVGLPLPGTIVEIRDQEQPEELLGTGQIGEICVRGPQLMQGYFHQNKETSKCLNQGIFHTGDVGYMDENGFIFVVDRLKEVIIAGGYKIYPHNVEEAILMHSHIKETAVIGVEDPYRGQTVKAFVVCKNGYSITKESLCEFLHSRLAAFAIPTIVECVETLPKTLIGKVAKKDLK